MPIHVQTHDTMTGIQSEPLLDPANVLHRVVDEQMEDLPLLRRIHWYQTTEFHRHDLDALAEEVDLFISRTPSDDDLSYLRKLRALVESCRKDSRCRLTFFGD